MMKKCIPLIFGCILIGCQASVYEIRPVPANWVCDQPVAINGELIETIGLIDQSLEPQFYLVASKNVSIKDIEVTASRGSVKNITNGPGYLYKIKALLPGDRVIMSVTVKKRLGASETATYYYTVKGKITPYVIYYNDQSLAVYRKSHLQIENQLKQLERKYRLKQTLLLIGGSATAFAGMPEGGFMDFRNEEVITVGSYFFERPSLSAGLGVLTHEYGHKKYDIESRERKQSFKSLYDQLLAHNMEDSFIDNRFLDYRLPITAVYINNSPQIYASAFMIQEMGLVEQYRAMWSSEFTQEKMELALKVFEFVAQ